MDALSNTFSLSPSASRFIFSLLILALISQYFSGCSCSAMCQDAPHQLPYSFSRNETPESHTHRATDLDNEDNHPRQPAIRDFRRQWSIALYLRPSKQKFAIRCGTGSIPKTELPVAEGIMLTNKSRALDSGVATALLLVGLAPKRVPACASHIRPQPSRH